MATETTQTPGPLRVCIVAEHASKRFGGEAILPYHYFRILLARGIDVHLIVHDRTRDELTTLFPGHENRLHFVRDKTLQKIAFSLSKYLPRRMAENTFGLLNQFLTQLSQRTLVRSLITPNTCIHQPIPVSPRTPSLLWNVGAPVIIGPMNGNMDFPPCFRKTESLPSRLFVSAARATTNLINNLLPGKMQAAIILVANERTRAALPQPLHGRVEILPENAVDTTTWRSTTTPTTTPPTFLFIGRLVDWKALDIALEALQSVPNATLKVIGEGPMLAPWQALTADLGLTQRVHFEGFLPQSECAAHLANARALLLPSIYECGGAVVLEAMAMSKPVIATAWGGPADYLNQTCGILIPPTSRAAMIAAFAQAMQRLVDHPETASALGTAGRQRLIENFDWERKVDHILTLYASTLTVS